MEVFTHILLYTHLLGFAAVAGGLLAQIAANTYKITVVILNGARWQMISGLALVAIAPADYHTGMVSMKLGIAFVILGICEALRKKTNMSSRVYALLILLVAVQTAAALFLAKDAL